MTANSRSSPLTPSDRCLIKPEVRAVATLKPTEVAAHRRVEHARAYRAVKRRCEAVPRGSERELPVGKRDGSALLQSLHIEWNVRWVISVGPAHQGHGGSPSSA